jgi:hypothetical protein
MKWPATSRVIGNPLGNGHQRPSGGRWLAPGRRLGGRCPRREHAPAGRSTRDAAAKLGYDKETVRKARSRGDQSPHATVTGGGAYRVAICTSCPWARRSPGYLEMGGATPFPAGDYRPALAAADRRHDHIDGRQPAHDAPAVGHVDEAALSAARAS